MGLPDGEEILTLAFFVLTQYRRVTDGETDRRTDRRTRCDRCYPRWHSVARVTKQARYTLYNMLSPVRLSVRHSGGSVKNG